MPEHQPTRRAGIKTHWTATSRCVVGLTSVLLAIAWGSETIASEDAVELTQSQRAALVVQLKETYNCDLEDVLFVRELKVGDQVSIEGRIRCLDQREVDFDQPKGHQRFEIRLCQPVVC